SARIGQRAEIALKARNGSLSSIRLPAQRIASQANFKSQKPICDSPARFTGRNARQGNEGQRRILRIS
ncbi:hypothetical protein, partial [Mesorhizobium sp. M2D.F.Ca.ET.140.01.1.1]